MASRAARRYSAGTPRDARFSSEPDSATEPQITITKRGGDQVEEYRMNGKLYMIKVTPPNGKTYYLIDRDGSGTMARSDVGGRPTSPPQWVIKRF